MSARLLRSLFALVPVIALPLSAAGAPAAKNPETDEDRMLTAADPGPYDPGMLALLSMFHGDPAFEDFEAFGPELREKLEAVLRDERVLCFARARALSMLAHFSDDEAFDLVVSVARDAELLPRLRLAALWTLGKRFEGRTDREAVLGEVLGDPDHGIRLQAINSLSWIDSPLAREIIDAHRIAERHAAVRAVLRDLLEAEEGSRRILRPEGPTLRKLNQDAVEGTGSEMVPVRAAGGGGR